MEIRRFAPDEHGQRSAGTPLPGSALAQWNAAVAAFKDAQRRGADPDELAELRQRAIRARSALTVAASTAGAQIPDDLLRHLLPPELRLDGAERA